VEYSRKFQARAAEELALLPHGSAIVEMMGDYTVMRDQARTCAGSSSPSGAASSFGIRRLLSNLACPTHILICAVNQRGHPSWFNTKCRRLNQVEQRFTESAYVQTEPRWTLLLNK
jgi:hypothetical protein